MDITEPVTQTDAPVQPMTWTTKIVAFLRGILPSFGWILLYFVLQLLCTTIMFAAGVGGGDLASAAKSEGRGVAVLWGLVLSAVIQIGLLGLYLRRNDRFRTIGLDSFGRLSFAKTAGLAVVLIIAAMIANFLYATYVIPGIGMQEDMAKMLASIPRTPVNIAAGFFAIAIAAPLVEELLFRGLLQNALARFIPIWPAILLSSFAFAAVHLQPYAIPGLMTLSIAFGYLYHRTGSLRTNILLHMLNNTAALLLTQSMV
jgi:membrane protease YdiL (CAAX protease family)